MNRRTAKKLKSLTREKKERKAIQTRTDRRWKETEKRIHALLAKARQRQQKMTTTLDENIAAVRKKGRATDKRLRAFNNLVERRIRERGNRKADWSNG